MKIQTALREYMTETEQTASGVSLRAGLSPKAVSDIMTRPGHRPRHSTLSRLSSETGLDLVSLADFTARTWSDLLKDLEIRAHSEDDPARTRREINRVKWLLRVTGWVGQTRNVCRAEVIDFFGASEAATFEISPGSYANYKSDILNAIADGGTRCRRRGVVDIGGVCAQVHKLIVAPESALKDDLKFIAGSFLVFLHDTGTCFSDITSDILEDYYLHRVNSSATTEEGCQKHVKRIANLVTELSRDARFAEFGFRPVTHPFRDGRDKFGVPNEIISNLLKEWDERVMPWAMGLMSRDGQTYDEFIDHLDTLQPAVSEKKARLRKKRAARGGSSARKAGRSAREALLIKHGFLTKKDQWNEATAEKRRGNICALAKAFFAATDEVIENLEDLTDPDLLEDAIDALSDANSEGTYDSEYAMNVLRTVLKVAIGFVCRDEADIVAIQDLIKDADPNREGIAPRNKAKLQEFTAARIQKFIDVSDILVKDINIKVEGRRKAHRQIHGTLPQPKAVFDRELAREVMTALAHAIMIKRGPRSANLIGIRLDWIRWKENIATIVIPAVQVKLRGKGDADLPIPLGASASKLLKSYLGAFREVALLPGDDDNPFLFPGQDMRNPRPGRPYSGILLRLTRRVHSIVGVKIHPHLYRHLIGWIWLREDIDKLPQVMRLLGHKSLQTTLDHYAEIDETLALDGWQDRLDRGWTE